MARYRTHTEAKSLPRFDPAKSLRAAIAILREAQVPYALIGRLAVWHYVPAEGQQFTKDADFAVPHGHTEAVSAAAGRQGYSLTPLDIGGCGARRTGVALDFIDRYPLYAGLFADAVRAARKSRQRVRVGRAEIPVVPRNYLIAMKLAVFEDKDTRDVQELLRRVPARQYPALRRLVSRYVPALAERLDHIARSVGHPGPGAMKRRYGKATS